MIKKVISLGALLVVSASASAVSGTMCYSENQKRMQTFYCPEISTSEELTISQINRMGYRVVSSYVVPEQYRMPTIVRLVLEKE